MRRKGILIFSMCIVLMGCGIQKKILEEVLIAEIVGFDDAGNNQIKGTTVVAVSRPGGETATRSKLVYKTVSYSAKDVRQKIGAEAPFPIVGGRLDVILYGEKLARKGLNKYLDTYHRDPNLGRDLYVGIVDGQAEKAVEVESKMTETAGVYTKELIEQNNKIMLPKFNLHSYIYSSHGKGLDPVMPLLEIKGDRIKIKGIALMKNDVYIGEYIPFDEGFLFKSLYENFKGGAYELKWKKDTYINISSVAAKSHYDISNANGQPSVKISVRMRGQLTEVQTHHLFEHPDLDKVEAKAEETLQNQLQKMVKKFQEYNIDPLAIGDRARSATRGFNQNHWDDVYSTIPITVKVDLKIIQKGISE